MMIFSLEQFDASNYSPKKQNFLPFLRCIILVIDTYAKIDIGSLDCIKNERVCNGYK